MMRLQQRAAVLFDFGASVGVADELLAYTQPLPAAISPVDHKQTKIQAEPHVADWRQLPKAGDALLAGLQSFFYQLCFPIEADVSKTAVYQTAVLRGRADKLPTAPNRLRLNNPALLQLHFYPSLVGDVPILFTADRADFVTLVQAFGHKNEPVAIPDSMGAALVSERVNWERLAQCRMAWLNGRLPDPFVEAQWRQELRKRIIPQKSLYRDTFILLSQGAYSGVPAKEMGLSEADWRTASYTIRLVHEAIHYAMRRLGIDRPNHLLDELLADFFGLRTAFGRFEADWFLRFMGLDSSEAAKENGRVHLYRKTLSDEAFQLLQKLLIRAAQQLEQLSNELHPHFATPDQQCQLLLGLASLSLEELAALDELGPLADSVINRRSQLA